MLPVKQPFAGKIPIVDWLPVRQGLDLAATSQKIEAPRGSRRTKHFRFGPAGADRNNLLHGLRYIHTLCRLRQNLIRWLLSHKGC